jgi:ribulose-phosphate 3-epimerase
MIDVIAGIYEKNFSDIEEKVALVAGIIPWVQIDISDGSMVSNISYNDIKPFKELIDKYKDISFEAHLMVNDPGKYLKSLADAGFKRIIVHVESHNPRDFIEDAAYESVEVGLAIDGSTELDQIEPFLDQIDFVLVMTAEAGTSGQKFMPETVDKIKTIRENLPDLPIEVDCGMTPQTAKICIESGATRIVSTSYIFDKPRSIRQSMMELRG